LDEDEDAPAWFGAVWRVALLWCLLNKVDEDPEYIDRLVSQLRNNQGTEDNHGDA
jgi:hypothetical protein